MSLPTDFIESMNEPETPSERRFHRAADVFWIVFLAFGGVWVWGKILTAFIGLFS